MSHTKKIAANTLAQMTGKLIGTGFAIATIAILFSYLGVEGVGKYTTVTAFVGLFSILADFGLQWTLIRELSVNNDHNKVFSNIFALRLILALAVHAIAFGVVWFFDYPLDVKYAVAAISAACFFTTINTVVVGVYLRNYKLSISVATEVVGRVLILALVWLFTKMNLSFPIVMCAYLFGNIVNFALNLLFLRRYVSLGLKFDLKYWRYVIFQAVPIGIVLVFALIYFKIDSLMLSMMKGMSDVGIYGAPFKLLEVLETIPVMFLGAAFPLITQYAVGLDERVKPAFQKQFDFLSLLAWPILTGTFVLAKPIIEFISGAKGNEFTQTYTVTLFNAPATSVTCLQILIFVVAMNFFTCLYNYFIVSLGKQNKMIVPTIVFALINIILNLILIPRFSYVGAAFATVITEIIVLTVYAKFVNSIIDLPVKFKNFFVIALCAVMMAAIIYFFREIGVNLFVNIFVAAACYTLLVLATKAVSLGTIREVLQRSK